MKSWSMNVQRIGGTVVVMERFDALEMLGLIERYQVTHLQVVPTMFVRLLKLPQEQRNAFDLSSLRQVAHAAAPCPVEVKERMLDWWGPIIREYYAGSESTGYWARSTRTGTCT
jgi:acyl-CoA synthetase (AMP-forming)/AMP-acid ligase II